MPFDVTQIDYPSLADALLPAILAAGAVEMLHYRSNVDVQTKADNSPVTVADQEAEKILTAALEKAAPGIPIVAEEAVSEGRVPSVGDAFFLVDPLDGTREFINQRDEFTVNVALVVARQPVFGIVYAPALSELYATLGPDCSVLVPIAPDARAKSFADCTAQAIRTRAPDVSALTAVASRSHLTAETEDYLARFSVAGRRNAGSSLKFCLIARGEADIYPRLGPTMEWDTAAGHAVLRAAGGAVTCPDGTPFLYGKTANGFLNPFFVAWGTREPIRSAH